MRLVKAFPCTAGVVVALVAFGHARPALAEGGYGITGEREARGDFLADGGSVRDESFLLTPFGAVRAGVSRIGDDPGFLEDGGSIRVVPPFAQAPYGRQQSGYDGGRAARYRRGEGSITTYGNASSGSGYFGGTGSGAGSGGGIVVVTGALPGGDPAPQAGSTSGGPKIIHVASARLDRRPVGGDGIETIQVGATRIIRLAPRYSMAKQRGEERTVATPADPDAPDTATNRAEPGRKLAAVAPPALPEVFFPDPDEPTAPANLPRFVPIPMPAPLVRGTASLPSDIPPQDAPGADLVPGGAPAEEPDDLPPLPQASASSIAGFEPWTEGWLRDCVARYPTFDATLGTFTEENGRRRFCTGD